ncbi:MAG: hypothetical protein FD174_73 [Geobacteraceae bacterium]|nr:MAG: hypothetical protein FD174_73 [Geobacteraceae bacterium]
MAVKFFGQYLVEKGVVTRETLLKAVELQESVNLSFGDIALSMEFLSRQDIERVNQAQRSEDLRFGDMAVKLGLLTQERMQQVLTKQKNGHLYIGEALVKVGGLDEAELIQYLAEFKADQAPYITERVTIPAGVPHPEIWEMAADLTYKMLTRIARLTFRPEPCRVAGSLAESDVTATIRFNGDINACYIFAVSRGVRARIAAAILDEADVGHEPQEVLNDTVMEFINVVCGNIAAKAAQLGKALDISPPEIVNPGGMEAQAGQVGIIFPICLSDGERAELAIFTNSVKGEG